MFEKLLGSISSCTLVDVFNTLCQIFKSKIQYIRRTNGLSIHIPTTCTHTNTHRYLTSLQRWVVVRGVRLRDLKGTLESRRKGKTVPKEMGKE